MNKQQNPMDVLLQIQEMLTSLKSELSEAKSTIAELKGIKDAETKASQPKPTAAEHLGRIAQQRMKERNLKESPTNGKTIEEPTDNRAASRSLKR